MRLSFGYSNKNGIIFKSLAVFNPFQSVQSRNRVLNSHSRVHFTIMAGHPTGLTPQLSAFNEELASICSEQLPVTKSKMQAITDKAIKVDFRAL